MRIYLIVEFDDPNAPTQFDRLKLDFTKTVVNWPGGISVAKEKNSPNGDRVLMRFIWRFLAFKIDKPVPQELLKILGDNLNDLNQPGRPPRGNPGIKQLFGLCVKTRELPGQDVEELQPCRVVDLFGGIGVTSTRFTGEIDVGLLDPNKIEVFIRSDRGASYRKAKSHELKLIVDGWEPVKGTPISREPDNRQRKRPQIRIDPLDTCTSDATSVELSEGRMLSHSPSVAAAPTTSETKNQSQHGHGPEIPHRRNDFFSGREKWLLQLDALLRKQRTPIVAVSGLGGIGKTQLVVEFAYRSTKAFSHILWLSAESVPALQQGYIALAEQLNLQFNPARASSAVEAVFRWLALNSEWLLILDNADNLELVEPLIPRRIGGHVVLTSRDHTFDRLGIVEPLYLPVFSADESVAFLSRRTRRPHPLEGERIAMKNLHEELAGLPLALEQAAAYIVEKQIVSFVLYLSAFHDQRVQLLEKQMPQTGSYAYSVATTWLMNFAEVSRISQASAELLRFSAFLQNSRPIPFSYIVAAATHMPPTLRELLVNAAEPSLVVAEVLAPLARFSLVHLDNSAETYTIHALVQEIVRDLDEC